MKIYQIINKITGDFYIGKTTGSLDKRFYLHTYDAKRGKNYSILHRAMRKYGIENFEIVAIEEAVTINDLNRREAVLIESLQPRYNTAPGGQGGALRIGAKLSDETKRKIGSKQLGRRASDNTRNKMSIAHAKTYRFLKDGQLVDITNLNKYCKEHSLFPISMRQVLNGQRKSPYKGFTKP